MSIYATPSQAERAILRGATRTEHQPSSHITTMYPDDISGYVECSCGWRSKDHVPTCWHQEYFHRHLAALRGGDRGQAGAE